MSKGVWPVKHHIAFLSFLSVEQEETLAIESGQEDGTVICKMHPEI